MQLCAQMFVLTVDDPNFKEECNSAKCHLEEMEWFCHRFPNVPADKSAFNSWNLKGALKMTRKMKSICTEKEKMIIQEKMEKKSIRRG